MVDGLLFWLLLQIAAPDVQLSTNALPDAAIRQIELLQAEKAARTPQQHKVDSRVAYEARRRAGRGVAQGLALRAQDLDIDAAERVLVDITYDVTAAVRDAITAGGGVIVDDIPEFRSMRAKVPFVLIEQLAELPGIQRIAPAEEPIVRNIATSAKVNTSQGDVAHRVVMARGLGASGAGVGVGVLSDGVGSLAVRQSAGDLPAGVTVLSGQAGSGDEGTAMLEIVHDLAPGAPLLFATAIGGEARFASNILSLCNAGAKVIVDDIGYLSEAVFEDGVIAQAVNSVTANGCHYFSAAGNDGNRNDGRSGVWEGDFTFGQSTSLGRLHSFSGASSNLITADPSGLIVLQWSDKWGASANDYDLYLFDSTMTTLLAASTNVQSGSGFPIETISSSGFNDLGNRLVVVQYSGANRYLHLNTQGGRLQSATSGSIFGHPNAERAYAIAAVNVATAGGGSFVGGSTNPVETFSSDGPRRVFFTPQGAPITPGNFSSTGGAVRQKPDLTAADGVATATPGFNPFFGTSAAAPHAAAIAALTLHAAGGPNSLSVQGLRNVLLSSTLDIEAPGVDRDSGYGILDAYRSVSAVTPTCTYSVLPTSAAFSAQVNTGSASVTTGTGCGWSATSNTSWLSITSGSPGNGSGVVNFGIASNPGSARIGTLTVAGWTITVNQAAAVNPPVISVHPLGVTIDPGQSVSLSIAASGTAPLAYQWYLGTSGDTSQPVASATSNSYTTPMLPATTSYWVRVSNAVGSVDSNTATVRVRLPFTDPVLSSGVSVIQLIHVVELRRRIDDLRLACGLAAYVWTDSTLTPGATPIRAVHLIELRSALFAVYAARGLSSPVVTDATIVPGVTVMRVVHMMELRAAIRAIE